MEDAVDAVHRPAHSPPVGDVPAGALELETRQVVEPGSTAQQQPQRVAALRERADNVRAQEPGASGDEGLAHEQPDGRAVYTRLNSRRHLSRKPCYSWVYPARRCFQK